METLEVVLDGPVCAVTLARPQVRNAMNERMCSELSEVIARLEEEDLVRVLVLRGAGPSFCVGADLKEGGADLSGEWTVRRRVAARWQRLLDRLERLPQVTVAALHGHVLGGGAVLALACDLRLAADELRFRVPELSLGMPLPWGGLPRLVRELGLPRARDLVLTGRELTAAEAAAWGVVQRVVAADRLDQALQDLVDGLLAVPAATLGITRSAFSALGGELATSWADADVMAWSVHEPEALAQARAFSAGRLRSS